MILKPRWEAATLLNPLVGEKTEVQRGNIGPVIQLEGKGLGFKPILLFLKNWLEIQSTYNKMHRLNEF